MEGDDDELEDSDCLVGRRTKCSTLYRPYFAHANPPRRSFEGGVYFTQRLQLCGVYSRAASIRGNTVYTVLSIYILGLSAAQYNEQMHAHAGTEVPHCALGVNCHT